MTVARGADGAGLHGCRVVVVGAGDMGRGVFRALSDLPASDAPERVVVVNRSPEARDTTGARVSEAPFEVRTTSLDRVALRSWRTRMWCWRRWRQSPTCSSARHFAGVAGPLRVIDLGVPRNVDPAVAGLDGVSLLDMDTLECVRRPGAGDRQEEAVAARGIVDEEVERFRTASRQRGAAPVISSLRARLESLRVAELERHRAQLADLSEEEWDHVDRRPGPPWPRCSTSRRCCSRRPPGHPGASAWSRRCASSSTCTARAHVRLATRGSPLALHQTELVAALLRAAHPALEVDMCVVRTRGDQDASTPLDQIGGQGVFVTEVEAAVADGRADAAVHSAKDMPSTMGPSPGARRRCRRGPILATRWSAARWPGSRRAR